MRNAPRSLIRETAIVLVPKFPHHEDPAKHKCRLAVVTFVHRNRVTVRGIYTEQYRDHRRAIEATYETGLDHNSYVDYRLVDVSLDGIDKVVGNTPFDFDPFDDFKAA